MLMMREIRFAIMLKFIYIEFARVIIICYTNYYTNVNSDLLLNADNVLHIVE